MPEVVWGPSEKEVNAFIKVQKFLRYGINCFLIFMIADVIGFISVLFCMVTKTEAAIVAGCLMIIINLLMAVGCFLASYYLKPLQAVYEGKVITYLTNFEK